MGTMIQAQRLSELELDDCVAELSPSSDSLFLLEYAKEFDPLLEQRHEGRGFCVSTHLNLPQYPVRSKRMARPDWFTLKELRLGDRRLSARLLNPMAELPAVPGAVELFKGFVPEEWIDRAVRERQRSAFFWLRASAPGLVFRFWVPRGRGIGLLARKKGEDHPIARARAWAKSLGDKELAALEAEAAAVASGLVDEIALVEDAFVEADGEDFLIDRVLTRRDDLQSVLQVLRIAGRGEQLREQLASVDEAAACHALAFVGTPERERSERLAYVATCEPDAWWSE